MDQTWNTLSSLNFILEGRKPWKTSSIPMPGGAEKNYCLMSTALESSWTHGTNEGAIKPELDHLTFQILPNLTNESATGHSHVGSLISACSGASVQSPTGEADDRGQ